MIEPQSRQARSGSIKRSLSRASSTSHLSNTRSKQTSDIVELFETFPPASRQVTPSMEASAVSRPTTPTLPSFSQSAKLRMLLVSLLNNNYADASDEQED